MCKVVFGDSFVLSKHSRTLLGVCWPYKGRAVCLCRLKWVTCLWQSTFAMIQAAHACDLIADQTMYIKTVLRALVSQCSASSPMLELMCKGCAGASVPALARSCHH